MREIKFRAWDKENNEWVSNDIFLAIGATSENGLIFEGKVNQNNKFEIS